MRKLIINACIIHNAVSAVLSLHCSWIFNIWGLNRMYYLVLHETGKESTKHESIGFAMWRSYTFRKRLVRQGIIVYLLIAYRYHLLAISLVGHREFPSVIRVLMDEIVLRLLWHGQCSCMRGTVVLSRLLFRKYLALFETKMYRVYCEVRTESLNRHTLFCAGICPSTLYENRTLDFRRASLPPNWFPSISPPVPSFLPTSVCLM